MADGRHFEKTVKSPYISTRLIDYDEIWHAGADWPRTGGNNNNNNDRLTAFDPGQPG